MNKMKEKKTIKDRLITILCVFGMIIGLLLIFNKPIRNMFIANQINENSIQNVSKEQIEKNKQADATYDFSAVQSISSEDVLQDAINNASTDASFLTIAGIAIPELSMNLPVYKGVDDTSLLYGAGTMKEDQEMGKGNYALASHHMFGYGGSDNLLFSPLERAQKGMKIYLTDKTKVYTYVISDIYVVSPDSVHVIDDTPGKTEVTLITCSDINATNRIIVKGDFVSEVEYEKASSDIKSAFQMTYTSVL